MADFTRWETDPDTINRYLQSVQHDPEYQLAVSRGEPGIESFLHERGYAIPGQKFKWDPASGQLADRSWWDQHKHWAIPAMAMGGAIAGPAAIGALAGGGGAAAGAAPILSTGVGGVGEAGAVTGLAGSGFGAGGGLGLTGVGAGFGGAATSSAGGILGGNKLVKYGTILGNMSANQAAGRRADEQNDMYRDRTALASYESGLKAPQTRLDTSRNASILKNWTPVTSTWNGPGSGARGEAIVGHGGYNDPNLIDPRTKQLADDTLNQQLQQQLSGGGGPPPLSDPRKNHWYDTLLGGAATGASLYGAYKGGV